MSHFFSQPCERIGGNMKVELDLSNYATKAYLKGATYINTYMLTSKTDKANLKATMDNLELDKLKTLI